MSVEPSPVGWALRPVQRYADFKGRASRAEYWWYALATTLIGIALGFVDEALGGAIVGVHGPLSLLFTLGLLVPGLAVLVRRLHDIGRSGWWALLSAGTYVLMIAGFSSATPEEIGTAIQGMGIGAIVALVGAWLVSSIVLLVFSITRGEEGANQYGPDPYGRDHLEEIFA